MNLLVTGGAGFIGSNFIRHMLYTYPNMNIVNLDALTYAANLQTLADLNHNEHHKFVHGDIRNRELVTHLINENKIDVIVNFAAESHVDRSIANPISFVETNVQGTLALLESAKATLVERFIHISTDEVYGSLGKEGYFTENSQVAPNSPYAASKAASDILVYAYYKTYGLDICITRCSNNYGPYQHLEKLIPLLITNGVDGEDLPSYGDGSNIRDWIYVRDHCAAIDLVLQKGRKGSVYNIGGGTEKNNNQIAYFIMKKLDLAEYIIKYVEDRPGHDYRYAINSEKIENELGWKPKYSFETGMKETIDWYINNESWWRSLKGKSKREIG